MSKPVVNLKKDSISAPIVTPASNETVYYEAIELTEIHHSEEPILQISYKLFGGATKTEFYKTRDVKHAVDDFLQIFRNPQSNVSCLKINWQSAHISMLLNGIEAEKPKLNLKIQKFISSKPSFRDSDEVSYLVSVLEHFQVRFILIRSGNMSYDNVEELIYTPQFQEAEGVALHIPVGAPIPRIAAPKLRITCDYISAIDVYNIAKSFTVRSLQRGSFFGIFIDSTFPVEDLRQLLAHRQVNDENNQPLVTCEWPVRNRHMVLHLRFSEKIVKGVVCNVQCVEYDFMRAQQVDE